MSLLSRLFGGGASKSQEAEPVTHGDYRIIPDPISEGGKYRLGARIEKDIGGETRVHRLIRADTLETHDAACEAAVAKARIVIDQQGDSMFD
ncbi:MAG: HlyU family transcriptional regulator [Pseudomonadota bacterium]